MELINSGSSHCFLIKKLMKIREIFPKIINYFKESREELKKVVWPTKQELFRHTLIVIGVSLATAAFLGVFDYGFSKLLQLFI